MKNLYEIPCKCPVCGQIRYYKRTQPLNYCPIKKCRHCAKPKTIGKKHLMRNGYIRIQTEKGWQYEHRYIWEQCYGPIPKGFVVHHKNHDRTDNRIENLELLPKKKHDSVESINQWELRKNGMLPYRKMPNQKDFDKNLLRNLLIKGLSTRQIAKMFNVSHSTIGRNIRDYGLKPLVSHKCPKRININKEELVNALKQARSMIGAARLLGISYDSVKKYMNLYKITPPPRNEFKKQYVDKETLLSALKENGSLRKAALALNMGRNVIRHFAKKYGISI